MKKLKTVMEATTAALDIASDLRRLDEIQKECNRLSKEMNALDANVSTFREHMRTLVDTEAAKLGLGSAVRRFWNKIDGLRYVESARDNNLLIKALGEYDKAVQRDLAANAREEKAAQKAKAQAEKDRVLQTSKKTDTFREHMRTLVDTALDTPAD
jgi:hypothetical protein